MFMSPLILEASTRPDWWIVNQPLHWKSVEYEGVVPVGFLTDLASIPRMLRDLPDLDPCGISRRPAVLHDWAYSKASGMLKAEADTLFRIALQLEGMSPGAAWAYYRAVHLFGGSSYNAR